MARTFVISDAHGYPELIQNALDHGGFDPQRDDFVYAGDLFDRGPGVAACIELVETYATQVLMGNHDVAVLLDFLVYPQDPGNRRFRPHLIDRVVNADPADAWKVATCVEGVLISHAGVSSEYQPVLEQECEGDPAFLAEHLNRVFLEAVRSELRSGARDEQGILGDDGPTWFRPFPWSDLLPLAGVRQVVGHTPPVDELEAVDFHMVDPCAFYGMEDSKRFRYAVSEGGEVTVVEGSLDPSRSGGPSKELVEVCQ